jgi:hypothetical protein
MVLPSEDRPIVINRASSSECSGSSTVHDQVSLKTVIASPKETPCLRRFSSAFSSSHSKVRAISLPEPAVIKGAIHDTVPRAAT